MKTLATGLFLFLALSRGLLRADEPGDVIVGVWRVTDGKGTVAIFKQNGKYHAKILTLKDPNWPADDKQGQGGKPKTDRRNPNPEFHQRPIVGMQFMNDFVYAGRNKWEGGTVYDPESGKTYKCKLTLLSTNKLEVHGFIGFSLLGRTVVWTR